MDASCALCAQEDETFDHILCSCVFATEVWHRLLLAGLQNLVSDQSANLRDWWQQAHSTLPTGLRRAFDSGILLAT
jgi:hypothetical protein